MVATRAPFCFAGFGTDRLRCEQAMKTAGRGNPHHWANMSRNPSTIVRPVKTNSRSFTWAAKQEIPANADVFFLDFFLYRTWSICFACANCPRPGARRKSKPCAPGCSKSARASGRRRTRFRVHLATGWPWQSLFHELALSFNTS
jgi:hypothetical protein